MCRISTIQDRDISSQLFLLGSITTWQFENPLDNNGEDLLNSFALVSSPGDPNALGSGSSDGSGGTLALWYSELVIMKLLASFFGLGKKRFSS
ncbi:MAG: hypothetical protein H7A29_06275 [Thermotogae bacterium]|nr:hypothetical protein [Thermotogota bacterium]